MKRAVFIVQGEGKGHLSQSVALKEYFAVAGIAVEAVFCGTGGRELPAYYLEQMGSVLQTFRSPYFLKTPNKKGIYIGRTILFNLFNIPVYQREVRRIRREITRLNPDFVINFYEGLGALAMKKLPAGIRRIGVGHHFLLHLEDYPCGKADHWHKALLSFHTRLLIRSCDKVLALSFRDVKGSGKIHVVPPLVRKSFREAAYSPGRTALVYLLNEGFITDLIRLTEERPGFRADVFSDLPPDTPMPSALTLHPLSDRHFREKMQQCSMLISTAGFDTVAEAASMGIPLVVVPVQNHFEQKCNSRDIERSRIGSACTSMGPGELPDKPVFADDTFRARVEGAGEIIIKLIQE